MERPRVLERVQSLVHEEVASAVDALALIVHATALSLEWKVRGDTVSLRDAYWHRSYTAEGRSVHTAVVRQAGHAIVLGTVTEVGGTLMQGDTQRASCTSWEAVLASDLDTSALPLRASTAHAIVRDELLASIGSVLLPLVGDAALDVPRTCDARSPAPAPRQPCSDLLGLRDAAQPAAESSARIARIGDADRDPLAASGHPPFPGIADGTADARGGDGMLLGPSHPLFQGPPSARPVRPERGPWAGDGVLPPGAVPPGARFDPVGPFAGNRPLPPPPGRFGGMGEPDWDDVPPPGGSGSMFL